jgi:hypothetical protein
MNRESVQNTRRGLSIGSLGRKKAGIASENISALGNDSGSINSGVQSADANTHT